MHTREELIQAIVEAYTKAENKTVVRGHLLGGSIGSSLGALAVANNIYTRRSKPQRSSSRVNRALGAAGDVAAMGVSSIGGGAIGAAAGRGIGHAVVGMKRGTGWVRNPSTRMTRSPQRKVKRSEG